MADHCGQNQYRPHEKNHLPESAVFQLAMIGALLWARNLVALPLSADHPFE